jgi:hypothetical protein
MPSNQDNNTHALLIGVDDYKSFNGTTNFDLKGSRNDVLLLASYCVEVLGMRAQNIVALTTPPLTSDDFEQHVTMRGRVLGDDVRGIVVGAATKEEVAKRLHELLDPSRGGTALLTFSGHGAAVPDLGPVLCLGDTAPDFKSGVLLLKTLRDDVRNANAGSRLIALLDCCHVEAPGPNQRLQGTSLPHRVAPRDVMNQEDLFRVSDRVFLAARPGMQAYQMRFGKLWHGALTFALVMAAERWQGEDQTSHGSYKHVLKRARGTLKALGVPQKSELRMPAEKRDAIRTQPFLGLKEGITRQKPDATGERVQLDPNSRSGFNGTVYTLTLNVPGANATSAPVLSVGATSGDWVAGKEYWALTTAFVNLWGGTWPAGPSTPTLVFTAQGYTTAAPPTGWNGIVTPTPHGSSIRNHWTSSAAPPAHTLYSGNFGVTVDSAGAVTWYSRGAAEPTPDEVVNIGGATFTTTQPTGGTWWILST